MGKEEKYVQKIKNDVDERLYGLLMQHLRNIGDKIEIHSESNAALKGELVSSLDGAITSLRLGTNKFNRLDYYRYIILLCNVILRFDTERQDLKDLKKKLIEDFTHSDSDGNGFIPLNYQMNEVRITYDVDYLTYLVKKYIDREYWVHALYCLKAVDMLEPDDERIDGWYRTIYDNLEGKTPIQATRETPVGKRLAIDSNIAISMISSDIGEYRFSDVEAGDWGSLSSNDLLITPSVRDEVAGHVEFMKVGIAKVCKKDGRFDRDHITLELQGRYDSLVGRYCLDTDIAVREEAIEDIRRFYLQFVPTLAGILDDKMGHYRVSHRLRKLAQREDLLPEAGDMALLSEILAMRDVGERVDGILSLDKDFTIFSGDILERFGIEIYMPR